MENNIDLSPSEFAHGVQSHPDAILLDVRRPDEFDSGHLPGAINMNIEGYDFHEQVDNLDPEKTYYVYCRSGGRSGTACRYLQSKGFREVYNLQGGILAWHDAEQKLG
jgi:rhodanese-related sulfurtransferase